MPSLESIALNDSLTDPTNESTLVFDIRFDMPVLGFDTSDLELNYAGATSPGFIMLGGGQADYTVTILGVSGDGTITLALREGYSVHTSILGMPLFYPSSTGLSASVTIDNTPPVITLHGDASVELEVHASWTDPGASASDTLDGTVPVTIGGEVVRKYMVS